MMTSMPRNAAFQSQAYCCRPSSLRYNRLHGCLISALAMNNLLLVLYRKNSNQTELIRINCEKSNQLM
jgi:hypothetical protein